MDKNIILNISNDLIENLFSINQVAISLYDKITWLIATLHYQKVTWQHCIIENITQIEGNLVGNVELPDVFYQISS